LISNEQDAEIQVALDSGVMTKSRVHLGHYLAH